jgi:hypothetical protein
MEVWKKIGRRVAHIGMVLCASTAWQVVYAQQTATVEQSVDTAQQSQIPDSPGSTRASLQLLAQQQAPVAPPQSAPQSTRSQTQSNQAPRLPSDQQQPAPQKPVGTAAAEPTHAAGVAASQPAGVAIAPAKQRRVRTIVIRTAAIIGAAAAVGTVVALTEATGSKPPGAH